MYGGGLKFDLKKGGKALLQGSTQVKHLSLKQMRELIVDIYSCKKKHDEKNSLSKLPKETMEQYMYTYLN